jgi:hypothetical protein
MLRTSAPSSCNLKKHISGISHTKAANQIKVPPEVKAFKGNRSGHHNDRVGRIVLQMV